MSKARDPDEIRKEIDAGTCGEISEECGEYPKGEMK